jgi:hypothetical protein
VVDRTWRPRRYTSVASGRQAYFRPEAQIWVAVGPLDELRAGVASALPGVVQRQQLTLEGFFWQFWEQTVTRSQRRSFHGGRNRS